MWTLSILTKNFPVNSNSQLGLSHWSNWSPHIHNGSTLVSTQKPERVFSIIRSHHASPLALRIMVQAFWSCLISFCLAPIACMLYPLWIPSDSLHHMLFLLQDCHPGCHPPGRPYLTNPHSSYRKQLNCLFARKAFLNSQITWAPLLFYPIYAPTAPFSSPSQNWHNCEDSYLCGFCLFNFWFFSTRKRKRSCLPCYFLLCWHLTQLPGT